jgi:hypothetical protein
VSILTHDVVVRFVCICENTLVNDRSNVQNQDVTVRLCNAHICYVIYYHILVKDRIHVHILVVSLDVQLK